MRIIRTLKSIQETTSREIYVDETITRGMILGDLIEETKTYLFNIDGDLVETKTSNIFSYFLPSRIMNSGPRFLYFYNKAGKLERKLKVDDDKVTESMIIIYDDFENKIDESYYNEKNELNKRNIYKYDNQGNCIQKDEYYSEVLFMKKLYKNSRKIIEVDIYNEWDDFCGKEVYKFDDYGNMLEEWSGSSSDSLLLQISYKYDQSDNKIEECNDIRNCIRGDIYHYEYEFDEIGNWIRQIVNVRLRSQITLSELNRSYKVLKDRVMTYYE